MTERILPPAAAPLPVLRLRLLGEFALAADRGGPSPTIAPRLQALLAYLVLHRAAPQSRQHLAFTLWPDSTDAQARTNLRNLLHLLHRALPEVARCLASDGRAVRWLPDAPCDVDVAAFESALARARAAERAARPAPARAALDEAVARYGGDLLPGCYDDWIAPERERLRLAYGAALERLLQLAEEAGDAGAAIAAAERLIGHDPVRELSYRTLMRLHARAGDRAAALRAYRRCAAALQRELGVEPSRALREDYERLLPRETPATAPGYHRLPAEPTPLIGRDVELAAARELVEHPGVRLLTLTGPGGSGKTRLALAVSVAALGAFAHGACFVDLTSVGSPDLVPAAIARALGLPEPGNAPPEDAVRGALRDRELLLVLDNFEHVLPAAVQVANLLAACPHLTVLATSRAPLRLSWEQEFAVPPLALPGGHLPPPAELAGVPAIALFCARARAATRAFALTTEVAPAVAEICIRLDGLPLAIELAAARTRSLSPAAIAARLDARFDLLTGGARDRPGRHHTLRGAIAWSYDLLAPEERRLFRRLAIFVGGGDAPAVAALDGPEGGTAGAGAAAALDTLTTLAEQNLLSLPPGPGGEPRFAMLETIREYAAEQLAASGEREAVAERHAAYFLALAEQAEPHLGGGAEQHAWLDRIDAELPNLRAAFRWLLDRRDLERALRLASAFSGYWPLRQLREGLSWIEEALAHDAAREVAPAVRAKALKAAGEFAAFLPDYARSACHLDEAVALYRQLGDDWHLGDALGSRGWADLLAGDPALAEEPLEESARLARATGHTSTLAWALNGLGLLARHRGDYDRAAALLAESLALHRAQDDWFAVASLQTDLGDLACDRGDYASAAAYHTESLAGFRALGDRARTARVFGSLGLVAESSGDHARAVTWYEERLALLRDLDDRPRVAEATWQVALALCRAGDIERAEVRFAEALGLLRDLDTERARNDRTGA